MRFRRNLNGTLTDSFLRLIALFSQVELRGESDLKLWLLEANLQFTLKSLYAFLNCGECLPLVSLCSSESEDCYVACCSW